MSCFEFSASNCKMKVLRKLNETLFLSSHSPVGIFFSTGLSSLAFVSEAETKQKKWSICAINIRTIGSSKGIAVLLESLSFTEHPD